MYLRKVGPEEKVGEDEERQERAGEESGSEERI